MKKLLVAVSLFTSVSLFADGTNVNGTMRNYPQTNPYTRTPSQNPSYDSWSTRGRTNPYADTSRDPNADWQRSQTNPMNGKKDPTNMNRNGTDPTYMPRSTDPANMNRRSTDMQRPGQASSNPQGQNQNMQRSNGQTNGNRQDPDAQYTQRNYQTSPNYPQQQRNYDLQMRNRNQW